MEKERINLILACKDKCSWYGEKCEKMLSKLKNYLENFEELSEDIWELGIRIEYCKVLKSTWNAKVHQ